eukprot:CAMPEP_0198265756 /NCGR_PEP_ID=MMETSP1447-20131203/24486_1 /TAXON_ID=420782 /ORGANISM="Chaetoceros dichaeta, Strain CCMP1751" /LENGTH=39 /DNA_ID= /DNA_START= /DNA_END= /DNA_ORIENTATION=
MERGDWEGKGDYGLVCKDDVLGDGAGGYDNNYGGGGGEV